MPLTGGPCGGDDEQCRRLEAALDEARAAARAAAAASREAERILSEIRRELRFPLVSSTRLEDDDAV